MMDGKNRNWARATEIVGIGLVVLSVPSLISPAALMLEGGSGGLGVFLGLLFGIPGLATVLLGLGTVRSIRRSRRFDLRAPLVAAPIMLFIGLAVGAFLASGYLIDLLLLVIVEATGEIGPWIAFVGVVPLLIAGAALIPPTMLLSTRQDGSGRAAPDPGTMSA